MKKRTLAFLAVLVAAAIALVGAPSAAIADDGITPGADKAHAIQIAPRAYEAYCDSGVAKVRRIDGVGDPQQYSFVSPRDSETNTWTATFQTGLINGVWYTFGEGTWQEPYFPNLSQVTQVIPVPACAVPVQAVAPTWVNPAGPGNLQAIVSDTESYSYTVKRYSSGKVQVNAIAKPGYVLTGATQWSKLDAN